MSDRRPKSGRERERESTIETLNYLIKKSDGRKLDRGRKGREWGQG
jgi:hypothetical protein